MHISDKALFLGMACELSPENLHCDGEISRSAAAAKYREIMKRWRALETKVGQTVSEEETWAWNDEVQRFEREESKRKMALMEQDERVAQFDETRYHRYTRGNGEFGRPHSIYVISFDDGVSKRYGFAPPSGKRQFEVQLNAFEALLISIDPALKVGYSHPSWPTLKEAVDVADAALAQVTEEKIRAHYTRAWELKEALEKFAAL